MKRWLKQMIMMVVVLAMIAQVLPGMALAATNDVSEPKTTYKSKVNPLYEGLISEESQKDQLFGAPTVAGSVTYYKNIADAGAQIKEAIKSRQAVVTVGYQTNYYSDALFDQLFDAALVHTGDPKEGDSLRWQWGYWNASLSYYTSGGTYCLTYTYSITYYTTAAQEAQLDTAVRNLLSKLALYGKTDYEIVCGIYDYICANVTYDYANLYNDNHVLKFTAYAALINKTAVCQGYALLFYRLALEMGVDARLIAGIGNGGPHGWNIVRLDGLYYNLDSTWDAGMKNYSWFLKSESNFYDHYRYSEYTTSSFHAAYPMAKYDFGEHEHAYDSVVTVPTCTEQGYTTHTCACGASYADNYVDALGHDMGQWVTTKEAACTEAGSKRRECSRCDHSETEAIEAAGHDYESAVTTPTCTEKGYTTHTCHCGDSYEDTYVDALGHDMGQWVTTKEATCTEAGSKRRECSRCDHSETEAIEAAGHDYESVVTAPTCTEKGYTTHTCHCGDSYEDTYVDALGHDMGQWVTTKEATCTEAGSKRRECSRCDHSETEAIEATGHDYESVVTAPTCTEQGYTTHACACGDSYADAYVDALGHDMGDWFIAKDAACTEDGSKRRECSRCDHYETEAIEAAGHDYESVVTAPTCTEKGYTTHTCHCGDSYVDTYVDALGHDMGDWFVAKDATCSEDGSKQRNCTRMRNGDLICDYFETETIPAVGHDYVDGNCSRCGEEDPDASKLEGLNCVDGVWGYYVDGELATDYRNLVFYNGIFYYVENGLINWDYVGLAQHKETEIWYYVQGGGVDRSFTGLTMYNGRWFYLEAGSITWSYTGLVEFEGNWYFVNYSQLNFDFTDLVCHNGVWYYVQDSILQWGYYGLVNYNGVWYYLENSHISWTFNDLVLYNDVWYYVKGSTIAWDYTGVVPYGGSMYYVENGTINWGFYGTFTQDGIVYNIENGMVKA